MLDSVVDTDGRWRKKDRLSHEQVASCGSNRENQRDEKEDFDNALRETGRVRL